MADYGTNDLVMTAGESFTKTFTHPVDTAPQSWTGRVTRLQMRHLYYKSLLVELTAFLTIDPLDDTSLVLTLPADWTTKMAPEGSWDLLSVSSADPDDVFRLPKPGGRILVLPGVTHD